MVMGGHGQSFPVGKLHAAIKEDQSVVDFDPKQHNVSMWNLMPLVSTSQSGACEKTQCNGERYQRSNDSLHKQFPPLPGRAFPRAQL